MNIVLSLFIDTFRQRRGIYRKCGMMLYLAGAVTNIATLETFSDTALGVYMPAASDDIWAIPGRTHARSAASLAPVPITNPLVNALPIAIFMSLLFRPDTIRVG